MEIIQGLFLTHTSGVSEKFQNWEDSHEDLKGLMRIESDYRGKVSIQQKPGKSQVLTAIEITSAIPEARVVLLPDWTGETEGIPFVYLESELSEVISHFGKLMERVFE